MNCPSPLRTLMRLAFQCTVPVIRSSRQREVENELLSSLTDENLLGKL